MLDKYLTNEITLCDYLDHLLHKETMKEKRLVMTGVKRKGEPGFKIKSEPPKVGPHLIHNGSGTAYCSVCAQPVNVPLGTCENCYAEFGSCD